MGEMSKIEAVITCVGYGDFLAATLPTNKGLFDYVTVVTTPEDKRTQRICEYWNVHVIPTDAFGQKQGQFRKGAGINEGLKVLGKSGWVVQMDADILLPPLTRRLLNDADLDTKFIYGIDRMMCKSFEEWHDFVAEPRLQQEDDIYVHVQAFPLGVRIATSKGKYHGYVPIGFFQMWHPNASGVREYPAEHTDAGRGDMIFAANWPRNRRAMIPEILAYRLESEEAKMGVNWAGRRTKEFGPDKVTE
jgi:hypothetical protein